MSRRRPPQPLGSSLPDLAGLIGGQSDRQSRLLLRLRFREDELTCRLEARIARGSERVADNIAKFGGGSRLTATVAVLLGKQPIWQVASLGVLALSTFLTGTILSALLEYRAVSWDGEADKLEAARAETRDD